ncbi:MAG: bifunctional nuclease family protein [Dysgonamonadaceae bacterium]|jgi:bifunctional DNase/RNase|nr:bifunctional nuclease family protein [Dysgonamonadaceae bacterium]
MVQLKIVGLTFSQVQAGAYALILAEEGGKRRIPIIVGTPEAQSIAIYLEGLNPPRPLTHDLFISFTRIMDVRIKQIRINRYEDGIFYSQVIFDTGKKTFAMEARTSDAIALALRGDAPIFIEDEIMNEIGIIIEDDSFLEEPEGVPEKKNNVPLESMHPEELQKKLNDAIAREDFEKASYLRDLIHKRHRK